MEELAKRIIKRKISKNTKRKRGAIIEENTPTSDETNNTTEKKANIVR